MDSNSNNQTNSEFNLFAAASAFIKKDFPNNRDEWVASPFEWILNEPAATKGKIGKLLISQWCALKNLPIDRSLDSEADILINHHRVEIKFSTLWKAGIYKFQQIRDQDYEYCVCLGLSPFDAHCWVISKSILLNNVIGHTGQHTGINSTETAWFSVIPGNPPAWLNNCGGSLEDAYIVLKSLSLKRL